MKPLIISGILIALFLQNKAGAVVGPGDELVKLERKIFSLPASDSVNHWLLAKARIFLELNEKEEAGRTLSRIDADNLHTSCACDYALYKSLYLFSIENNREAMLVSGRYTDSCSFRGDEFRQFRKFLDLKTGNQTDRFLSGNYGTFRKAGMKWIPGKQLMANGFFAEGLSSLGLTVGFLTFGAFQIGTGFYATGIVSGIFPGARFWSGAKSLTMKLEKWPVSRKQVKQAMRSYR